MMGTFDDTGGEHHERQLGMSISWAVVWPRGPQKLQTLAKTNCAQSLGVGDLGFGMFHIARYSFTSLRRSEAPAWCKEEGCFGVLMRASFRVQGLGFLGCNA